MSSRGQPAPRLAGGRLAAWVLVVAWGLVIFVLSSVPDAEQIGRQRIRLDPSTIGHGVFFGILGFLVMHAVHHAIPRLSLARWWTFVLVALYGVLDELHQVVVPGRSTSIVDLLVDGLGGFLGAAAWTWLAFPSERSLRLVWPFLARRRTSWLVEPSGPASNAPPPRTGE
jgi:VanZ family protein